MLKLCMQAKACPCWFCQFLNGLPEIGVLLHLYYMGGFGGEPVVRFPWFVSIITFLFALRRKLNTSVESDI